MKNNKSIAFMYAILGLLNVLMGIYTADTFNSAMAIVWALVAVMYYNLGN